MFRNKYSIPAHLPRCLTGIRTPHTKVKLHVRCAPTLQATSDEQANEVILINRLATKGKMWARRRALPFYKDQNK